MLGPNKKADPIGSGFGPSPVSGLRFFVEKFIFFKFTVQNLKNEEGKKWKFSRQKYKQNNLAGK